MRKLTLVVVSLFTLMSQAQLALAMTVGDIALLQESQEATAAEGEGLWARVQAVFTDDALDIGKRVLLGLLLFIAGWIAAKFVAWVVYRLLARATKDSKLADKLGLDKVVDKKKGGEGIEYVASRIVYYVLMLLVVVGVLQYAGLTQAAAPIESFVDTVMSALPLVGKAVLIMAVAYFLGLGLSKLVSRGLDAAKLDNRFAEMSGPKKAKDKDKEDETPFSETVGRVVFWLVMVGGLAGAFDALEIKSLSDPMSGAIDRMVGTLPDLGVALLLVIGGYLLGRVARTVIRNLLDAAGFDKLIEKIKLNKLFSKTPASDVVGIIAMVFIVLQASIAALTRLELTTLSEPLAKMVAEFWHMLPLLLVAGLILVIGVVVARLARRVVEGLFKNFNFDDIMERLGFGHIKSSDEKRTPSELLGMISQIAIILFALVQALEKIELHNWADFVAVVLTYAFTRVVVALVIVGVGFAVGNYVREFVLSRRVVENEESLKWISELARYTILVFGFTMAIHHLEVAEGFVMLTFGLLFGSLCLSFALALGLGAREVAGDFVKRQYSRAREQIDTDAKK